MKNFVVDLSTGIGVEKEIVRNVLGVCRTKDNLIIINERIYTETINYLDENNVPQIKRKYSDEELSKLGYVKVILEEKYLDYKPEDFNEDLTFSVDKYNARKQKENNQLRIFEIKARLEQLSQDFIQVQAGAIFEDLEERKAEFQTLHNELRVLLGVEPRVYV